MAYKYRMILSFLLAGLCLYLVATVFAKSIWEGPLFLAFSFYSLIYGCVMLYKWKPTALKSFSNVLENFSLYHGLNIKQAQNGLVFLFPKWSIYDRMEGVKI